MTDRSRHPPYETAAVDERALQHEGRCADQHEDRCFGSYEIGEAVEKPGRGQHAPVGTTRRRHSHEHRREHKCEIGRLAVNRRREIHEVGVHGDKSGRRKADGFAVQPASEGIDGQDKERPEDHVHRTPRCLSIAGQERDARDQQRKQGREDELHAFCHNTRIAVPFAQILGDPGIFHPFGVDLAGEEDSASRAQDKRSAENHQQRALNIKAFYRPRYRITPQGGLHRLRLENQRLQWSHAHCRGSASRYQNDTSNDQGDARNPV